jgi:ABC-2 type transport system ATP-binding protein
VLLLDEPTNGVDPVSRRELWGLLHEFVADGTTVIVATAYLDEAERCDRLALLHAGTMMHCDTPQGLKARMPGVMLELVASDARRARDAVCALPGVLGTMLVGSGVHVHVDAAPRAAQIQAALAAQHIQMHSLDPVAPSIEDLFVALLERSGVKESG